MPRRAWGTGAKVLTWIGSVLLALGIGAGVFGAMGFTDLLPVGVITSDGEAGANALGGGDVPGSVAVTAEAGDIVVIWEVREHGSASALSREDVRVTLRDEDVPVSPAQVNGSSGLADATATTLAQFTAPGSGDYTIEVTGGDDATIGFVAAQGDSLPGFVGGVFLTVFLWLAAVGLSVIGVGLLIGGIVWGMTRARR